jgi:uncharacterized membrane protein
MKALLALVFLAGTAGTFYMYIKSENVIYFVAAIVCLILMLVFGGMFLSGRVNKTEDIHITE